MQITKCFFKQKNIIFPDIFNQLARSILLVQQRPKEAGVSRATRPNAVKPAGSSSEAIIE